LQGVQVPAVAFGEGGVLHAEGNIKIPRATSPQGTLLHTRGRTAKTGVPPTNHRRDGPWGRDAYATNYRRDAPWGRDGCPPSYQFTAGTAVPPTANSQAEVVALGDGHAAA